MLTVKLIYGGRGEELCRFSALPELGQSLVIDGLTYHVLEINRALNNTDPNGPEATIILSEGSQETPDNRIPQVQPKIVR